jgi:hypothetical protein
MREEGMWAGHMELQATSLLTRANICIHKVGRYYQIRDALVAVE